MGKSKRQTVYKEIKARKQKAALKELEAIRSGNKIIPDILFYDDIEDEMPDDGAYVSNSFDMRRHFVRREPMAWKAPFVKSEPIVLEVDGCTGVDSPSDKSSNSASNSRWSPELYDEPPSAPVIQSNSDDRPRNNSIHSDAACDVTTRNDTLHDVTIPEDTPHDVTIHDDTLRDVTIPNGTPHDVTIHDDTLHDDTPQDDTIHDDTPQDDTPQDDTIHDNTIHSDTTLNDTSLNDTSHNDTIHNDTIHNDTIHNDTINNDTINNDRTRQDESDEKCLDGDISTKDSSGEVSSDKDSSDDDSSYEDMLEISIHPDVSRKDISYASALQEDKCLSPPASPDAGNPIVPPGEDDKSPGPTPELFPTEDQQPREWLAVRDDTHDAPAETVSQPKALGGEWHHACHPELLRFDDPPFVVNKTGHIEGRKGAEVKKVPGRKGIYSLTLPVGNFKKLLDLDEIMISTFSPHLFNSETDYIFHKDGNALNHAIDNLQICSLPELQKLEINLQQELHPGVTYTVAYSRVWGPDLSKYLVSDHRTVYSLVDRTYLNTFENETGEDLVRLTALNINGKAEDHIVTMDDLIKNSFSADSPFAQDQQKRISDKAHVLRPNSPDTPETHAPAKVDYLQNRDPDAISTWNGIRHVIPESGVLSSDILERRVISSDSPKSRVISSDSPKSRTTSCGSVIHFILNGAELMHKQQEHTGSESDSPPNEVPHASQKMDALRIQYLNPQATIPSQPPCAESYSDGEGPLFAKVENYDPFSARQQGVRSRDSSNPATLNGRNMRKFNNINRIGNDIFESNTIKHYMPESKRIFKSNDQDSVMRAIPDVSNTDMYNVMANDQDSVMRAISDVCNTDMYNVMANEPIYMPTVPSTRENDTDSVYIRPHHASDAIYNNLEETLGMQQSAPRQHRQPAGGDLPPSPPEDEESYNVQDQITTKEKQNYVTPDPQKREEGRPDTMKQRYYEGRQVVQRTWQDIYEDQRRFPLRQPNIATHSVSNSPPGFEEDQNHVAQVTGECQEALEEQLGAVEHSIQEHQAISMDKEDVAMQAFGRQQGDVMRNIPKEEKALPQEAQGTAMQSTQNNQQVVFEKPQPGATNNTTNTETSTDPPCTVSATEETRWLPIGTLPWSGKSYSEYEVSDAGEVRKIGSSTTVEAKLSSAGHMVVRLESDQEATGKRSKAQVPVSRIVAKAFIEGYSESRSFIKHRNRNPQDNRAENLEWVDRKGLMAGRKTRTVIATRIDDPSLQKQFPSVRQAELAFQITLRGIPPNGSTEKYVVWDNENEKRLVSIQVLEQ